MSEERSVTAGLYQWLCRELGHASDEVVRLRANRERVVLLKDPPAGPLQSSSKPLDGHLTLVDQEPAGVGDEGRGRR